MAYTYTGLSHTRIDNVYKSMKSRCYNPNNSRFHVYGKRGITVCDEWLNDKRKFFEWALLNGYDSNAKRGEITLDRIDVNKGYCPENCRFVDMKTQENNRSNNKILVYKNESHTISEWEEITGFNHGTIRARINRGWDVEKALTTPAIKGANQYTIGVING